MVKDLLLSNHISVIWELCITQYESLASRDCKPTSFFPWGLFFALGAEKRTGTLFSVTWEISSSAVPQCYSSIMIQKWEKQLGRKIIHTGIFLPMH